MWKSVLIGAGIYVLGFLVVGFSVSIYDGTPEYSYYRAISYAILYLAAVIAACTAWFMRKSGKDQ